MANDLTLGLRIRVNDDGTVQVLDRVERGLNDIGQAGTRASTSMTALASVARYTAAAFGAWQIADLAKELVKTIEQVQNLEVRLRSLTASAEDYANATNYINQLSREHHKNNLNLQESFASLLSIEQTGIITRQQSQKILEGLSNAQSKTGASADQLRQSMIGMSQALGMGTVAWEEIKQITEPMPGLMNAIAKAVGFTGDTAIGEFKKLVSEGDYTSKMLGEVLPKAFEQYSGAAEKTANNLTAKYNDVANAWTELAKSLEDPVTDALSPILEFVTWQLGEFVKQANYVKSLFPSSSSGGGGDNGMAIGTYSLVGRPKPPAAEAANSGSFYANQAEQLKSAKAIKEADKIRVKEMRDNELERERLMKRQADAIEQFEKKRISAIEKAMEAMEREIETEARATQSAIENAQRRHEALTMSPREQYQSELKRSGVSEGAIPGLMQSFDTDAGLEAQKKKNDELKQSLEAYNQTLEQTKSSMNELGSVASAVFDSSLGGVSSLTGAFGNMVDALAKNTQAMEALNIAKQQNAAWDAKTADDVALKASNTEKYQLREIELEKEKAGTSLSGLRQITGATSKMFDENSKGRKILHAMEMGFAAVEIAMKIKSLAVDAAKAVLNQGSGDPYSAFARMAAMGAIVGGIVAAAGGAFSSSSSSKPISTSENTGTVLGNPGATSSSAKNIYDLLKDIHASEYTELRGINSGVSALNGGIDNTITKLFQGGGIKDPSISLKGGLTGAGNLMNSIAGWGLFKDMPIIGSFLNGISSALWGGLFGKTAKSIVGGGISINPMQMSDYLGGGGLNQSNAAQYSLIEVKKKSWFSTSSHYDMAYQELNDKTEKALTDVFGSMGETMIQLADKIGSGLSDRVRNYIIPGLNIELRGLSGEDASKKLSGVISAEMDSMASAIFGDIVGQYQKLGEGMAETAVRIVAQMAVVTDVLSQSGLAITSNVMGITNALSEAAGGLEKFQQAFETYYDKFYSTNEKQNRMQLEMVSALNSVGLALPTTINGYRKLIESLDINNEKDQQRYTLLINMANAADKVYQSIANLEGIIKSSAASIAGQFTQLANEQKQLADKYANIAKSIREYKTGLIYTNLSTGSKADAFDKSKVDFYRYADIIRQGKGATGYESALTNIQGAASTYLEQASSFYASGSQYKNIFETVNKILGQSVWGANGLAKDAKTQLDLLNEQADFLKWISGDTKTMADQLTELVRNYEQYQSTRDPSGYNPAYFNEIITNLGNGLTLEQAMIKAFETVLLPVMDKIKENAKEANATAKESNTVAKAAVKVAIEANDRTVKALNAIAEPAKETARQARIKAA